jgi:hypothetical protein
MGGVLKHVSVLVSRLLRVEFPAIWREMKSDP